MCSTTSGFIRPRRSDFSIFSIYDFLAFLLCCCCARVKERESSWSEKYFEIFAGGLLTGRALPVRAIRLFQRVPQRHPLLIKAPNPESESRIPNIPPCLLLLQSAVSDVQCEKFPLTRKKEGSVTVGIDKSKWGSGEWGGWLWLAGWWLVVTGAH